MLTPHKTLRAFKFSANSLAGLHPATHRRLVSATEPEFRSKMLVGPSSRIVADGFGGSANSYLVAVLIACGVERHRIAHHHHSAAQFIEAARRQIPAVLILRSPAAAIESLIRRDFLASASTGFVHYSLMHERIRLLLDHTQVVSFETLAANPALVVETIADRFDVRIATPRDLNLKDRNAVYEVGRPGFSPNPTAYPLTRAAARAKVQAVPELLSSRSTRAYESLLRDAI